MTTETKEKNIKVGLEPMISAGLHFGYSKSRRHPSMKPYIFGAKNGVEIIDLEKTVDFLETAKAFASTLGQGGKKILFVGSKNEAKRTIKASADSIGMPYVIERWIGGTLTNWNEIQKRVKRMQEIEQKKEKGELSMYTKKERLMMDREFDKLDKYFGGIAVLKEKPHALFVVDSKHESIAVKEAHDIGIPVIALTNSDCDLKSVEYPIPGNDAVLSSINYIVEEIVSAYKGGANAS